MKITVTCLKQQHGITYFNKTSEFFGFVGQRDRDQDPEMAEAKAAKENDGKAGETTPKFLQFD